MIKIIDRNRFLIHSDVYCITMSSKVGPFLDPNAPISGDDAKEKDPWEQAWDTLSNEDKKQYGNPSLNMLEVLNSVCERYSASSKA